MSQKRTENKQPRHKPGEISFPESLKSEKKPYSYVSVCQNRKLIAALVSDTECYITFFRYHPKPASSSSTTTSSATAASSLSNNNNNDNNNNSKTSSSCLSSLDYTFEKLSAVFVRPKPWDMIFGDRYLFFLGQLENRVAVIDLNVATSESEEERKKAKVEFSSFKLPDGYCCEYNYGPVLNTSLTKFAFIVMSFVGSSSDFNGVVILDVSKSYNNNNNNKEEEEKVPEENAFPTISAIMDEHDEETQSAARAQFSIIDDGARIAYLSGDRLKVCDVATKEKTFELDFKEMNQEYATCFCLFHPTEPNLVLLAGGGKVRFYDVKAKTKLREFNLFASSQTKIRGMYFPTITSESRYLLASLYDKGEGAEENINWRLDVIDTVDGTVIQSTPLPASSLMASSPFLSYNTMLLSEKVSGVFLVKGIALSLWNSRRKVFLIREKSASSTNRIVRVLSEEYLVLVLVTRFVA